MEQSSCSYFPAAALPASLHVPSSRPTAVIPRLQAVKDGPAWGVDAWGLGCLMQEVYSGRPLARTEDLRNTGGYAFRCKIGLACWACSGHAH